MTMFAGLDVGFKRTAICVVDERGGIVWRGAGGHASGGDRRRCDVAGRAREGGAGDRLDVAVVGAGACGGGLCGGVHGRGVRRMRSRAGG